MTSRLYRLALEKAEPNARYHAVAEEGVPLRDIAATIGPEEAQTFFGWLGLFAGLDMAASGARTRSKLGWAPIGPTLLANLDKGQYVA